MAEDLKPSFDDFEFSEQEIEEIGDQMVVLVKWRSAMAQQGIKVLSLGLSAEEEISLANEWYKKAKPYVAILAVPTEGDIAEWNSLTREQQLKVLQEVSHHPDSITPTNVTMADIKARLRHSIEDPRSNVQGSDVRRRLDILYSNHFGCERAAMICAAEGLNLSERMTKIIKDDSLSNDKKREVIRAIFKSQN